MSTTLPLVSIGLPVYNGEKFLSRAVESLLAQDYPNVELILSNNCSTDGTRAICERFASLDSRIRVNSQDSNIGASANWEWVLNESRGTYFMWAAHDDCWKPAFVSTLVRELQEYQYADLAMCALQWVSSDLNHLYYVKDSLVFVNSLTSTELFQSIRYQADIGWLYLNGLFRTEFLKQILVHPFPRVYNAEVIVAAEMALATRFRFVNEVLHVRTKHPSTNTDRYPDEPDLVLRRQGLWTPAMNVPILKERIWQSRMIPFHRKLFALAWLKCSTINLQQVPGGSVLQRLYRGVASRLG